VAKRPTATALDAALSLWSQTLLGFLRNCGDGNALKKLAQTLPAESNGYKLSLGLEVIMEISPQTVRGAAFMKESRMKISSFALLFFVFQIVAVPIRAGDIKEADYPVQYEVLNTSKSGTLVIEKFCSMTLRDRAKPNVALNVEKKGYGSCHVPDNGKVFHGRQNQKKNEIELVIPEDKGKARVEDWQIIGTTDINPSPNPA
jgi:hypothetical protein